MLVINICQVAIMLILDVLVKCSLTTYLIFFSKLAMPCLLVVATELFNFYMVMLALVALG